MLEGKVLDVEKQRSYRCAFEHSVSGFSLLSTAAETTKIHLHEIKCCEMMPKVALNE